MQNKTLKATVPDCLLLMQVGVFLQVMDEDARAVSQVTGLKRQMGGDIDAPVVVGGFPLSGLDVDVGKLVRAGYSVAIALQDEHKERRLKNILYGTMGASSYAARSPGMLCASASRCSGSRVIYRDIFY